MAGLIQNAQQGAPAVPGAGMPPGAGGAPGGAKANPQQVSMVVHAAMKIIHDPQVSPKLVEQMKSIGDPVQALAKVTLQIMQVIYEKSGKKIPPEVMGEAGIAVLQLLGELAQSAGLFRMTMDIFKQATQAALDMVKQGGQGGGAPPGGQPAAAGAPPPVPAAPGAPTDSTAMA